MRAVNGKLIIQLEWPNTWLRGTPMRPLARRVKFVQRIGQYAQQYPYKGSVTNCKPDRAHAQTAQSDSLYTDFIYGLYNNQKVLVWRVVWGSCMAFPTLV